MKDKYCHLCKEYGHSAGEHKKGHHGGNSIYSGHLANGMKF